MNAMSNRGLLYKGSTMYDFSQSPAKIKKGCYTKRAFTC